MLSDRTFERAALHYLRIVFPDLITPPARGSFDAAGADHLVWADSHDLPVVVQCKGFEVDEHEIGSRQIRACLQSIQAFKNSRFAASTYLLVHNRTDKNADFREQVGAALLDLRANGLADIAELWSADTLVKRALTALYERLQQLARDTNLSVAEAHNAAEPELCEPTVAVPFRESMLTADQYRLTSTVVGPDRVGDVAEALLQADTRFAMLVGYAGFGKTTSTVRIAEMSSRKTFLVPAARFDHINTRDLLEQCVDIDALASAYLPEDQPTVRRAAKLVVEHFFKTDRSDFLLLIDGLDESFLLSQRGGLQQLFNALRLVGSRVVLTARKEFLDTRAADFASSVGTVSTRAHRVYNQSIKMFELLPWTDVNHFARSLTDRDAQERVVELAEAVGTPAYDRFYGDIPRRPLFLRFILETVAARGMHRVTRSALFEEWARLKIARDVVRPTAHGGTRTPIAGEKALDDTIDLSFAAMALAARCMTTIRDDRVELLATCRMSEVLSLPSLNDQGTQDGVVLNSLLVPTGPRSAPKPLEVRFSHRAYQEYFLSRYLQSEPTAFGEAILPIELRDWPIEPNG